MIQNSLPTKSNSQSRGKKHKKISDHQSKSHKIHDTTTSLPPITTKKTSTTTKTNCLPARESSKSSQLQLAPSDSKGTAKNQDQTQTPEAHKRVSSGLKSNRVFRLISTVLTKAFVLFLSTNWTNLRL
jgi:hypothetical protein